MIIFIVEHLITIICMILGANAYWGLMIAGQLRDIAVFCKHRQECEPPNINQIRHAIFVVSSVSLIVMLVSSVLGMSFILEILLMYSIFHSIGLLLININICKFWRGYNTIDNTN